MKSIIPTIKKPYAIVFALDSINGLQTARILASKGIPVIGIASDPKHPCSRTMICEDIICTNTENDELIRSLELLGPKLKNKAVLFPCNNLEVQLVSQNRHRLEKLVSHYLA